MSISLIITINVLADISLVAGLAYVMSHAARLKPHVASVQLTQPERQAAARRPHARSTRSIRPHGAATRASLVANAGRHAAAAHES